MTKMKNPISALYDYPPKIQERVRSLDQYKDRIPTKKDRLSVKLAAAAVLVVSA